MKHRTFPLFSSVSNLILGMCVAGCASEQSPAGKEGEKQPASFSELHQSSEAEAVSLSARMQRNNYMNGPIFVDYTLTNLRHEGVMLNHRDEAGDIYMNLTLDGLAVPQTDFGSTELQTQFIYSLNIPIFLKPQGSLRWRYDLRRYFRITKPGAYTLSALRVANCLDRPLRGAGDPRELEVELLINPIRFQVEAAPLPATRGTGEGE